MTLTPDEEKAVDRIEEALISGDPGELIQQIYATTEGGAGCCWHIVTDDGNLEAHNVAWCAKLAEQSGHPLCIALGKFLTAMTEESIGQLLDSTRY